MPHPPRPPSVPVTFGQRATRWFVSALLVLVLAVSGYAVWSTFQIDRDPELRKQFEEVHERAARGAAPTDTTGR